LSGQTIDYVWAIRGERDRSPQRRWHVVAAFECEGLDVPDDSLAQDVDKLSAVAEGERIPTAVVLYRTCEDGSLFWRPGRDLQAKQREWFESANRRLRTLCGQRGCTVIATIMDLLLTVHTALLECSNLAERRGRYHRGRTCICEVPTPGSRQRAAPSLGVLLGERSRSARGPPAAWRAKRVQDAGLAGGTCTHDRRGRGPGGCCGGANARGAREAERIGRDREPRAARPRATTSAARQHPAPAFSLQAGSSAAAELDALTDG
jgi:hypothetical protein